MNYYFCASYSCLLEEFKYISMKIFYTCYRMNTNREQNIQLSTS